MATQKSQRTTVMALLDAGADPNIKHRDKLTVKDLAAHLSTDEVSQTLYRFHTPLACSSHTEISLDGATKVFPLRRAIFHFWVITKDQSFISGFNL